LLGFLSFLLLAPEEVRALGDRAARLALPAAILAYLIGIMIQALASWVEPLLFWVWGGKPSRRLLLNGSAVLPTRRREHLEGLWEKMFDRPRPTDPDEAQGWVDSAFGRSYALAKAVPNTRLTELNAHYAMLRSLLMVALIVSATVAICLGCDTGPHGLSTRWTSMAMALSAAAILFWRCRQYGYYWAREVIDVFEASTQDSDAPEGQT